MSEGKDPRARSVSGENEDSDLESHHTGDGFNPPGKPGRKKNPNSQAARRDQNRIAQREFRLRKQQRIRDLEARVEILSGGKDEALGEMRNILRDLMAENHTLRGLLRSLASFIGEGAGGLLPKLGWDMSDFNDLVNRSETDTAWESYQRRKKTQQAAQSSAASGMSGQKRTADDDSVDARAKKPRLEHEVEGGRPQNGYSILASISPSLGTNNEYSPPTRAATHQPGIFPDIVRNSDSSPMFMQPAPGSTVATHFASQLQSHVNNFQASFMPSIGINIDPAIPPLSFAGPSTPAIQHRVPSSTQVTSEQPEVEDDDEPSKNEAYKLIHYHLDNYKRNNAYCLPSSLRPTLVQRTVQHESVIDGILHPELRDRMILLRNKFDLVDCLHDYRSAVTIHGDDVLAHSNWEIGEKWLRQYGFLIDQVTLNTTNRWRRERGEAELRLSDIAPSDGTPGST